MLRLRKANPAPAASGILPMAIWREYALLIHDLGGGDRMIVGEGELQDVAARLAEMDEPAQRRHMIYLPERRKTPFHFTASEIFHHIEVLADASRQEPQLPA